MPEEVSFPTCRELCQLKNFRAAPASVVFPNSTIAEVSITGYLLLELMSLLSFSMIALQHAKFMLPRMFEINI